MTDTNEQRPATSQALQDPVRRVLVECPRCSYPFALTIYEYTKTEWRRLCPRCQDGGGQR
jgi:hypothetical protein